MPTDSAENFRRLFRYEQDSHATVLSSLEATASNLQAEAGFKKAVDLLAHVVAARQLWLFRLGQLESPPAELFPQGVRLGGLPAELAEMHRTWGGYLATLTDAHVEHVLEYRSNDGKSFRNDVGDILTQLYGHSLYHRGQIALLLRQIGARPAATDFIFWARAVP